MPKNISILILSIPTLFLLCGFSDQELPLDHPILGSWKFNIPGTSCAEIYTFQPNKTRTFTSGTESGESRFEISLTPSAAGFYKVVDTIIKTNKKPDCSGGTTPEGDKATLYLRFNRTKDARVMCQDESSKSCFGPYQKVERK